MKAIALAIASLFVLSVAHAGPNDASVVSHAPAHVPRHGPVQVKDPSFYVRLQAGRYNPLGAYNSPRYFAVPTAREIRANAALAADVRRHGVSYVPGRFAIGY